MYVILSKTKQSLIWVVYPFPSLRVLEGLVSSVTGGNLRVYVQPVLYAHTCIGIALLPLI